MVRGVYPERKSEMLRCASYSSLRSDDKVPCHPEHTHFAQCKLREGSQSIRWFAEFILSGKARCFDALVILRSLINPFLQNLQSILWKTSFPFQGQRIAEWRVGGKFHRDEAGIGLARHDRTSVLSSMHQPLVAIQIGRASCRERV